MIRIEDYRRMLELLADDAGISQVMAVTVDEEMGRRLSRLPADSVTLFFLPPLAEVKSKSHDALAEENQCVLFVMRKYDPQRLETIDALAQTQDPAEAIKASLVEELSRACSHWRLDITSVSTMPETQFYRGFAGWSLGFTLLSAPN